MNQMIQILRNKYFIASAAFVIWMAFFDRNDLHTQINYKQQLNGLREEKAFYEAETAAVLQDLEDLDNEGPGLRKFARERYLMKKDNEDIYVIVQPRPDDNK